MIDKKFIKDSIKREVKEEPVGFLTRLMVIGVVSFMMYGTIAHNGDFVVAYETLNQLIKG